MYNRHISAQASFKNTLPVCYYSLRGTLLVSGGRASCKLANQSLATFSLEKLCTLFEVIYLKSFMGEQTGSCLALFLWKLKHGEDGRMGGGG